MSTLFRVLNSIVSLFVLVVALFLVAYMVFRVFEGGREFFFGLLPGGGISAEDLRAERLLIEAREKLLLHAIAFTIVLVKAYRILISYVQTHHLNIKFLVEISIIAPAVEVVFNSQEYSVAMNALFVVFGLANLLVYVYFYDRLKQISNDYKEISQAKLKPLKIKKS